MAPIAVVKREVFIKENKVVSHALVFSSDDNSRASRQSLDSSTLLDCRLTSDWGKKELWLIESIRFDLFNDLMPRLADWVTRFIFSLSIEHVLIMANVALGDVDVTRN